MTEEKIIQLLLARDQTAVAELQHQYGAYCAAVIGGILTDPAEREQVLNDVWMQVWSSIPPNRPDHLRLYVARIARNLALNRLEYLRAQKRSQNTVPLDELRDALPDSSPDCDRQALKDALERFLGSLSPEYRQMFLRRYWYGDAVGEIARRFGCSQPRVTGILFRVRRSLKEFLKKEELYHEGF